MPHPMMEERVQPVIRCAMHGLKVKRSEHIINFFDLAHNLGRLPCQVSLYESWVTQGDSANLDAISKLRRGLIVVVQAGAEWEGGGPHMCNSLVTCRAKAFALLFLTKQIYLPYTPQIPT